MVSPILQPEYANGNSKEVLDSWKEIASFLNRGVRTVQRWEQQEGFPIHRHDHKKRATVFAVASEVQEWVKNRSNSETPTDPVNRDRSYSHLEARDLEARCIAARARALNARAHVRQVYEHYQAEINRVLARISAGGNALRS